MNICIYTVHLVLYECITCKVKSCSSNYCTFHNSYVTTNRQKYKIASIKKIVSLLLVRPNIFINITSDVFHCHAPGVRGGDLFECRTHPLQWSAVMSSHAAFMHQTETSDLVVYDHILSTSILKTMVVIVLWAIYIYCICSQTWLVTVNGWFKLYRN